MCCNQGYRSREWRSKNDFSARSIFPENANEPVLIYEQRMSVISFGSNFILKLPARPDDWIINEDAIDGVCIATKGNDIFFRIPNRHWALFVNLKNGELCNPLPAGIFAYTKAWEISIPDADMLRVVVHGN